MLLRYFKEGVWEKIEEKIRGLEPAKAFWHQNLRRRTFCLGRLSGCKTWAGIEEGGPERVDRKAMFCGGTETEAGSGHRWAPGLAPAISFTPFVPRCPARSSDWVQLSFSQGVSSDLPDSLLPH